VCTRGSNRALLRGPSTSPLAAMRIVQWVVFGAACFGAGTLLGFYISWRNASYANEAHQIADVTLLGDYLLAQSANGTPAEREAALLHYLEVLKRIEAHPSTLFTGRVIAVDEALTYAKLAEIAKQRSDAAAVAGYLSSAAALCPLLAWEHCSAADIADVATRLHKGPGRIE
jgi:hypothetical protein